jgi:DNA invertase Pin-like site-specific DNA recombinase
MATKAFAYLRVSGRGQVDGDGFPRQLEAVNRFAEANDLKIARVFREEAVTGKTEWGERAAWSEMLDLIVHNGVRTILIERLDRLARDVMVQEHIIQDLRTRSITLISAQEPDLCQNDPTRNLLRQIMGAIAEYDRCMIVLKLRGARQRKKAATGRCEGRKPYGFRQEESPVLQRMRELASAGGNYSEVARALNAEGMRPRGGGEWHPYAVARILQRSAASGNSSSK